VVSIDTDRPGRKAVGLPFLKIARQQQDPLRSFYRSDDDDDITCVGWLPHQRSVIAKLGGLEDACKLRCRRRAEGRNMPSQFDGGVSKNSIIHIVLIVMASFNAHQKCIRF
jgi:hypothetical protein